jgi:hypothetical protein
LAAQLLGVAVDGVPVGGVGPGWIGDRLPAAGPAGEDLQPVGCDDIGIVDPGVAGGVVVQRRPWRVVAVAVAVDDGQRLQPTTWLRLNGGGEQQECSRNRRSWSQVIAARSGVPANVVAVWSQSGTPTASSDPLTGAAELR